MLELVADPRNHVDGRCRCQERLDWSPLALSVWGKGSEGLVLGVQEVVDPEGGSELLPPGCEARPHDEIVSEGGLDVRLIAAEELATHIAGAEGEGEPARRVIIDASVDAMPGTQGEEVALLHELRAGWCLAVGRQARRGQEEVAAKRCFQVAIVYVRIEQVPQRSPHAELESLPS